MPNVAFFADIGKFSALFRCFVRLPMQKRLYANASALIVKRCSVCFFVAWRFVKLNERSLVNERALVDEFLSAH
jgi:hypothetical protein